MDTAIQQTSHLAYAPSPFFAAVEEQAQMRAIAEDVRPDETYLYKYLQSALKDDFLGLSTDDAANLAIDLWLFQQEAGDQRLARVRPRKEGNENDIDIVETVGADAAFLVDSTIATCVGEGRELRAVVNIILDQKSKKHSLIQIHLAPLDSAGCEKTLASIHETLSDVVLANADYEPMRKKMMTAAARMRMLPAANETEMEDIAESADFLDWLWHSNFIFLGTRDYALTTDDDGQNLPVLIENSGMGILRNPDRFVLSNRSGQKGTTPGILAFLKDPKPVIVAKSNTLSLVHRRVYADYIGIKRRDENGNVVGETRIVGLFTSEVYNCSVRDIPMIRRKVSRVRDTHNTGGSKHSTQTLEDVLENFPRDELFQISGSELLRIARGILALRLRPRTRLFIRRDRFDRFVSALMFTPRENFSGRLQRKVHKALADAYGGRMSATYANSSDASLARAHFIIGLDPGHPEPDEHELDALVASLAQNWEDNLIRTARLAGQLVGQEVAAAFSAAYAEKFPPEEALIDLDAIGKMPAGEKLQTRVCSGENSDHVRCKLYHRDTQIELSDMVPILENMGLRVFAETGYRLVLPGGKESTSSSTAHVVWIHDVTMEHADGKALGLSFADAFKAVWTGRTENDGFNQLVTCLDAGWREASLLRTLCRYRQQSGMDPSEAVQISALIGHAQITAMILQVFALRLDPANGKTMSERTAGSAALIEQIDKALESVPARDDDRVLRRLCVLVGAIQRTNFYRGLPQGEDHIAIKIASRKLYDLPNPKPFREIFVWSPVVEGTHLRFGPVARGGLRWSDRRDDFRTEVLGLVKAQQVKNAVIVPVGSKGCFYPKKLPRKGSRDAITEAGIAAYEIFVGAMIELTDNILDGAICEPDDCVVWDEDDPYLVVAADKGTAAFSDIANRISTEHGFWLGDAFASGGSVGYDHKKMGITARGAWEAVKRHFREMGKDIQSELFTAIGVGDMSGDVFGNGMLLSKHTRLLAAFNHQHIFIDPDPDPEASWNERKRLFDMPRSSWTDYSETLISEGGGVFARDAKSIALSEQMQALTGIDTPSSTPEMLIAALLRADAELLWFGGVGTYVKSGEEQHFAVGDKANDSVRADADKLRAKVIGEGANLAITQAGRVSFARSGGRINTDALDNSAGVDSSDHEVNIKILLAEAIALGQVKEDERADLLASMTDEVATLVLQNNYDQTGLMTLMEAGAAADLGQHGRLIEQLEAASVMDRAVEGLPDAEAMRTLVESGAGLTRPELSVLAAYAKIDLFNAISSSDAPDDPAFESLLLSYFPEALSDYAEARRRHRLRREIISTILANRIVNAMGPVIPYRICDTLIVNVGELACASEAACAIFGIDDLFADINALDNKIPAIAQTYLRREVADILYQASSGLCRQIKDAGSVSSLIARHGPGVALMGERIEALVSDFERARMQEKVRRYVAAGAPSDISERIVARHGLIHVCEIADIVETCKWPLPTVVLLYTTMADILGLDRMRAAAVDVRTGDHWDLLAASRIAADLPRHQIRLTMAAIEHFKSLGMEPENISPSDAMVAIDSWINPNQAMLDRLFAPVRKSRQDHYGSLARLILASGAVDDFVRHCIPDRPEPEPEPETS